jgi:UDP-N-acetylglucosamine 4-epimerase
MTQYEKCREQLQHAPRRWLVTGAAGFIGSNIVEELLRLGQRVVGLDDFSSGHQRNLDQVQAAVGVEAWSRFEMIRGDIRDADACARACRGADHVLHHAAIGSVPASIDDPLKAHDVNVTGTLRLMLAAREAGVKRFVYASSSAVYGDDATLPKVESALGHCLSPYAVTKLADELYAQVVARCFGLEAIGLRYFNIFGARQDPNGAYAAVIPKWIAAMMLGQDVIIFGDGETTRDFCHVSDVVQANILAATAPSAVAVPGAVFNVARHGSTTLNELYEILRSRLAPYHPHLAAARPVYRDFRVGDVRHSEANIAAVGKALGYAPVHTVASGLDAALAWYRANLGKP